MKKLLIAIGCLVFVAATCNPTQERVTYNSLYSLEQGVVSANDAYLSLVAKGVVPTNNVPAVEAKFNLFQGSMALAVDTSMNNTNALAPASLQQEANDLINLINISKGVKK